MNYVTSITERTIWAVDYFLNRAMVYAWTSVLKRQQQPTEDDYGGGDFCSCTKPFRRTTISRWIDGSKDASARLASPGRHPNPAPIPPPRGAPRRDAPASARARSRAQKTVPPLRSSSRASGRRAGLYRTLRYRS